MLKFEIICVTLLSATVLGQNTTEIACADTDLNCTQNWPCSKWNLENLSVNDSKLIFLKEHNTTEIKSNLLCHAEGYNLTIKYAFETRVEPQQCRGNEENKTVNISLVDTSGRRSDELWSRRHYDCTSNFTTANVTISPTKEYYILIEIQWLSELNPRTLQMDIRYTQAISKPTTSPSTGTSAYTSHTMFSPAANSKTTSGSQSLSESTHYASITTLTSTSESDQTSLESSTSASQSSAIPTPENLTDDNNSKFIIIGASAGGAFIVLIVVILLLVCWRRRMLCCKPHHNQPNTKTRSPQTRDHTVAYTMWRVDPDGNEGQSNGIANRGFDPETAETGLTTPVDQQHGATNALKTETVMFAPVKTQQTGANGASKTETEVQETEMPDYAVVKKKTKKQAAARYDYTNVTKPKAINHPGGMKLVLPKPDPAETSQNTAETTEEDNKKTSLEAETNALIPKSPKSKPTKKSPMLPTDTKGPTSKQKGPAGVLSKDKGPAGVLSKDKGPAGVPSKDKGPAGLSEDKQNVPKSPPPVAKKPQVAVKPFRPGNIKVPVLPSDHKLSIMSGLTGQDPVLHKPEQEHENAGKPHMPHQPSSSQEQEQEKATKSNKPQPSSEQKQESQGKPPKVALLPPTMKGKNKAGNDGAGIQGDHVQATQKAKEQLIGQSDHVKAVDVAGVTSKEGNSRKQDLKAAENRKANISAQEKLESNGGKGKPDSTGGSASPDVSPQDRLSGIVDDKGQFYFILDKETHEPVAVEDDANYAYAAEENENYSEIDSHQNHPNDEKTLNPDRNQNRAGSYYEIADPLLSDEARPESATYSSIDDQPAGLSHSAKEDSADGYYSIADMPSKVAATSEETAKRDLCYSLATIIAEDNELSTPDDVGGKEDYNTLNFDGKNGAAVPVRKDDGEGGEQVYSHLNAGVDEDVYSHTERDVRKVEVIDDDYSHINIQQQ